MKLNLPELLTTYRDGLLNDTLPFWFPRAVDTEHGGFLHCFDRDGSLLDTDKSVWVQGRMAWMLLTLHNTVEKRAEWLEWARGGVEFIDRHCFDTDGRMYFHVTREGRPIRKRRYAYSESFAAIAHAPDARATGTSPIRSMASGMATCTAMAASPHRSRATSGRAFSITRACSGPAGSCWKMI